MSKKKVFHSFSDAGHGWVRVSVKELIRMEIADKITAYSYLRGAFAYLEEDADLATFVNRKRELGEEFSFKEYSSTDRQSKIRNYDSYDGDRALFAYQEAQEAETAKKQAKKAAKIEASLQSKLVTRKNAMTGEDFQEPEDTPYYLSPSSETYHCS